MISFTETVALEQRAKTAECVKLDISKGVIQNGMCTQMFYFKTMKSAILLVYSAVICVT